MNGENQGGSVREYEKWTNLLTDDPKSAIIMHISNIEVLKYFHNLEGLQNGGLLASKLLISPSESPRIPAYRQAAMLGMVQIDRMYSLLIDWGQSPVLSNRLS
jgi:hypothetical protein